MKQDLANSNVKTQTILLPEIVQLDEIDIENIISLTEKFNQFGFKIVKFGNNAIELKEIPENLGKFDCKKFILDICENLRESGSDCSLEEKFSDIYGNIACRYSIRAGRKLKIAEMNAILRQMEETPFSGQCNHGRPTYVKLETKDLEKLFGRR